MEVVSEQKNVEIHQSLARPVLISGAERELVILIGMGAVLIWIAGKDFSSFLLAVAIWFVGMFLARQAAKMDGQMVKVFLRHIRYQEFYPATEKTEKSRGEGGAMQQLSNFYKKKENGLPSLVNHFMLADEGIMLNKDGSFSSGFYYRPPDMASADGQERENVCRYINDVLGLMGTGWLIHVDLIKVPAHRYQLDNAFPDPMLRVLEQERKDNFETQDRHFEIIYAITLTYKSPAFVDDRVKKIFISNVNSIETKQGITQALNDFCQRSAEIEAALGNHLMIRRMNSRELLEYLHYCLTGKFVSFSVPQPPVYLDHFLGLYDFTGGISPKIDEQHIGIVAVTGFPQYSFSGMLEFIQSLPFEFRFSSRFIVMDPLDAEQQLKKVLVKWHNKQLSLRDLILETLSPGSESPYGNLEAANKAADAHQAVTLAQEGSVKFGYYTPVFVVMGKDKNECRARLEAIRDALRAHSCPARIEGINAVEAFRGSLPGDSLCNVRQPLIHTLNLSHLLSLQGIWPGEEHNPNPKLPPDSPPLFLASTVEGIPFSFNNFVADTGHTLICGPTGMGKSTLLGLITTQFLRYPDARVFCFDRKYGLYALFTGCSARHYEILSDDEPVMFCPLQNIRSTPEIIWAAGWLEDLIRLQGVTVTPEKRQAIRNGLEALKADKVKSLSNYYMIIQDREIRGALEPFIKVKSGVMASLMDGENDSVLDGYLQVFETGKLFQLEARYVIPVLLYLFHQIDRQLNGQPVLIAIDEAWLILNDPVFVGFLQLWLRELRKSNGCVVFCTQHVNDVLNSPVKDVIIESTPVKIYLPNPNAVTAAEEEAYLKIGLSSTETRLLASAIPKRHYYYTSSIGKRLIDLELGPVFLSFMGKNNAADIREIKAMQKKFCGSWPGQWLRLHKFDKQAEVYEQMVQPGGNQYEK